MAETMCLDQDLLGDVSKLRRLDIPDDFNEHGGAGAFSVELENSGTPSSAYSLNDVLAGDKSLPVSHAGGEFMSMLLEEADSTTRCAPPFYI